VVHLTQIGHDAVSDNEVVGVAPAASGTNPARDVGQIARHGVDAICQRGNRGSRADRDNPERRIDIPVVVTGAAIVSVLVMPSSAQAAAAAAPVNQSILSRVISDVPTSTLLTKPYTSPLRSVDRVGLSGAEVVTVTVVMAVVVAGVGVGATVLLGPDALAGGFGVVVAAVVRASVAVDVRGTEALVGATEPGAAVPPVDCVQAVSVIAESINASRDNHLRTVTRTPRPLAPCRRRTLTSSERAKARSAEELVAGSSCW
jgi:hypothetical protein